MRLLRSRLLPPRGYAVHECLQARVVREAAEVGRWNHDQQVAGQKDTERGQRGAERSPHQVTDEGYGDDHRAGCDHRDRHRVEELPLGQPLEVAYDPP